MKLEYKELNLDKITEEYNLLLLELSSSNDFDNQLNIIEKINNIRDNYYTMYWLSYINYLLDVNSEYWNKQEEMFAKWDPIINNLKLKYYEIINKSIYKNKLKKIIGNKLFMIAEEEVKMLSDDILDELSKEKELNNLYNKLIITTKIKLGDDNLSLSELKKYLLSSSREERFKYSKAKDNLMLKIETELDKILDDLIKERTSIAHKLGYKSYTDVGYIKLKRIGYNKKDVELFRSEVVKTFVPLVQKMRLVQKSNLELDDLMYYDEPILFKDGNAKVLGDTNFILDKALEMYKDISPKLYNVFKMMKDNGLMDLESREGKSAGGITTYLPNYKVPTFISNFKGISEDVSTLFHEFGHSFQLYSSKDLKYYENWWPTFDTCEIHSLSMELLTLPYAELFFGEDKDKYKYEVLYSMIYNMCYICLVDEFQHVIYDEYDLSINERKLKWLELENKYMPWLNLESSDYLIKGNRWQLQTHIFDVPFYYIDYALASSIALQFYKISLKNPKKAWDKYIEFCSQGGSYSFMEIIKKNKLLSPFEVGNLEKVIKDIK